jgi:UDP-N-acetylglucosamine--N-acetylmuramyl-(pentapeptide) pyrophosphoryl-undecaprenol N-acetylglucosamine transferase
VTARSPVRVLIAGGGTGGHVFPGVAVADALRELGADVLFVGTARGLEARVVPERGYALRTLQVEPMKGGGIKRFVRGAWVASRAVEQAFPILRDFRPHAVLSVGGYAAGPVSLAACLMRIPTAIFEPNRVVGFANKLLAPFATCAYLGASELSERFGKRARFVGVPLRAGFVPHPCVEREKRHVLILGGSQGAQALNEGVPKALAKLSLPLSIVHQTGKGREEETKALYNALGLTDVTVSAFLDNVPAALAEADLVIARSGASTVAEICAVGRASILVPFPHAADDHQWANAKALEDAGGCIALRQATIEAALVPALERLLVTSERRVTTAAAAQRRGRPDAASTIARDLLELAAQAVKARARV